MKPQNTRLFSFSIFLASFLIFSLEPMTGKVFLPIFGGSSVIWTVLMLFFTTTLFGGYVYAHFLTRLQKTVQQNIHVSLIILSVITIFFNSGQQISSIIHLNPTITILLFAVYTIGIPFFVLSSVSILLQSWYTQSHPGQEPYFLYQISNMGALAGLISYPILIEPNLTLSHQKLIWNILYVALCISVAYIQRLPLSSRFVKQPSKKNSVPPGGWIFILWFTLALIPNLLLLSGTSFISQGIAPVPLLWIIPLVLYLISYIVGFRNIRWYPVEIYVLLISILTGGFGLAKTYIIVFGLHDIEMIQAGLLFAILFLSGLVFHHELYLRRPKPSQLSYFYIAIALGGIIAAILCALVAPTYFSNYWELPLTLFMLVSISCYIVLKNQRTEYLTKELFAFVSLITIGILIVSHYPVTKKNYKIIFRSRNFYGMSTVKEKVQIGTNYLLRLYENGVILHGSQSTDPSDQNTLTTYYTPTSGIGMLIDNYRVKNKAASMRLGVIGLGVGMLSAYCQKGDYIKYYEINPLVIDIANKYFTYNAYCIKSGGGVDIVEGDARMNLADELQSNRPQGFDILVVDAFTDDTIPIHLLTTEAIMVYLSHLSPGGVLAFHTSNIFLDLAKILSTNANKLNLSSYTHGSTQDTWFIMTRIDHEPLPPQFYPYSPSTHPKAPWTDDYSDILSALR